MAASLLSALCLLSLALGPTCTAQETAHCDPQLSRRFEGCPEGHCCVRDEYLPAYVYCKRLGHEGDNCTTRDSESGCPCMDGLTCQPNVQSASFVSMYGKCHNATAASHQTPA